MTPVESDPGATRKNGTSKLIEEEELLKEVIRLSRNVLGLTLGMLFAFGIFLATNILVLKGGPTVGTHLQLLNQYFPGYRVTFAGSFLGSLYGWIIAAVYNWVVLLRHG